ncbi:MAG: hypothetical protein ACYDGY_09305 [Acidimicrobiales bacterium]
MGFEVDTRDCSVLSDSEFEAMAELSAGRAGLFDIGFLSKQRDEWVLVCTVKEGLKLRAYSFFTLERIGGTPAVLLGMADTDGTGKSARAVDLLLAEHFRKAVLAFPDEDVLVCGMAISPAAYMIFHRLNDVVPRPGYRPTGEERAWARRIARRFSTESRIDDRTFVLSCSDESGTGVVNLAKTRSGGDVDSSILSLFGKIDHVAGERIVVCGWAMAEDLASGALIKKPTG